MKENGLGSRLLGSATLLVVLVAATSAGPSAVGDNLLSNGDFESGGRGPAVNWQRIWPTSLQDPAPEFEHPEQGAVSGDACVTLETFKPGGFSSYTQRLRGDTKADMASFRAWARVDDLEGDSSAALLLLFLDEEGKTLEMRGSQRLKQVGDWQELVIEAKVPEGSVDWMVRCGIYGQGKVAFDDARLTAERLRGEHVSAHLAVHFGTYVVRTKNKVKDPWIALSVPFPFERQSPLGFRVSSDPPGLVQSLRVLEDEENRPLRVNLLELEGDMEVMLRVETLAMVIDRPLSDGEGVELVKSKRVPKAVRPHLEEAPGIDLAEEKVKAAAESFDRSDLRSLMKDVMTYLDERLTYSGGSSQGAAECLERGEAVCTGFANVAASLLIAADVPTRILASTQMNGRLQEHYIVESWTQELGWSRAESTMAKFPWADTRNLILRVVYPEAFRSGGDVPLYVEHSKKVTGGFYLDPKDTCWQGADSLPEVLLSLEDFEAIEEAARAGLAGLIKKDGSGDRVALVPADKKRKKLKLKERGERVLKALDDWLVSEQE